MRRFVHSLLLMLLGLSLCLTPTLTRAQTDQPFPVPSTVSDAFLNCVPELKDYSERQVLYSTTFGDYAYYTVAVNLSGLLSRFSDDGEGGIESHVSPEKRYWEVTVSFDRVGHCLVIVPRNPSRAYSLEEFMPAIPAQQLALQHLQFLLQHLSGGAASITEDLQEAANYPNSTPLTPEYAWALKQVGIALPKGIKVAPVPKMTGGGVTPQQGVIGNDVPQTPSTEFTP